MMMMMITVRTWWIAVQNKVSESYATELNECNKRNCNNVNTTKTNIKVAANEYSEENIRVDFYTDEDENDDNSAVIIFSIK